MKNSTANNLEGLDVESAVKKITTPSSSMALATVGAVVSITLLGAFAIEAAGYPPCTLCLYQRVPYFGLGLMLAITLPFFKRPWFAHIVRPLMLAVLSVLIVSAGLGIFHAGVEFALWDGPKGCSGTLDSSNIDNLLETLRRTKVVSCNKASFWVLGLSLSVWNAIISSALAAVVGSAALQSKTPKRNPSH
jgi:disulfide bond formation protein DsbB